MKTVSNRTGDVSSRRITAFWFVVLATTIIITCLVLVWRAVFFLERIDNSVVEIIPILKDILQLVCGMILLLFGVTTVQNIAELKNPKPPKNEPDI